VKNYIIRIYRKERGGRRALVGTAEEVGREGRRAFTNFDELREILNSPAGRGVPAKREVQQRGKRAGSR